MSLLVVGLSHRSAPVSVLERAAVGDEALGAFLHEARSGDDVLETMIVSTCNRVEVYAEVDKFHGAVADVSELLSRHSGVPLDQLTEHLYVHYGERALQHMFAVVCGLDSMAVGEGQILGQVRRALKFAQRAGTVGRTLGGLGQQALHVGKRAHAETDIDRVGASLVAAGLSAAEREIGSLAGKNVLVVGAGSMSSLAATTAARHDAGRIVVANRTPDRGARLASSLVTRHTEARAVPLGDVDAELADTDVVISCTGAAGVVVDSDAVRRACAQRPGRGMAIVDLALPHDVDPAVREHAGVTLIDLEVLRGLVEQLAPDATQAVADVRSIVAEEVSGYAAAANAARVTPTVVALRNRAADVVELELARLGGRLPDIDEHARDEIATAMRRVADKLLHAPTVRVKELAASPDGDSYAAALRELFDLDPKTAEAVSRADVSLGGTVEEEGGVS